MSSVFWSSTSEELLNNRYKIQRELGCNAGRYTFLAKDLQNQQLVVIKLIVFNHDFQWESLKLFEREVEILKSLSHPAIPRYIEYFEVNIPHWKGFAFVQNYIKAESLEEHLRNGRTFSESEVKQLAKTLLGILNYLHSHNPSIIHRDIKPSNILLSNSSGHSIGDIYLVDFGSVQNVNHQEGTITIVGTYGYMSPEQFVGRAFPASDLYSLGITIIYLISGTEVEDLTQEDWQFIQLEQLSNISSKFRDWLKLMTHRSLKKRFRSVPESLEALEALESTKSTLKKPPLSKVIFIGTDDSIKITVPFISSNNGQKSDLESVREIDNYQQLKSQTKIDAEDTVSSLRIAAFILSIVWFFIMVLVPIINLRSLFITISLSVFLLYNIYLMFSNSNSYIAPNSNYIDSLNLQLTQHDITFSYTYYEAQKIQTVFQYPRKKISHLLLERKSYQLKHKKNSSSTAPRIEEVEVPPDLCLQVNGKKYGLNLQINSMLKTPENHKLTAPEIYWLAEEVSIFLDIPITWV